jgi:lipoate-protein ligase A
MVTERECMLVKFEGFNQIFEEYLSKTGSKSEAYKLTEKEYKKAFRENRYSSYESFRKSRERLFKK